jgi:hypothetical protein
MAVSLTPALSQRETKERVAHDFHGKAAPTAASRSVLVKDVACVAAALPPP